MSESSTTEFKKRKKPAGKRPQLSFAQDAADDEDGLSPQKRTVDKKAAVDEDSASETASAPARQKLRSNPNAAGPAPRAMTKANLAAEAVRKQRLQEEFLELQERVRASEVAVPFVFFDGNNIPGGTVKVKKGEQIWLLLEKCRKVGINLAVHRDSNTLSSAVDGHRATGRASWARIGVDDLMLVRGETIIPHHYDIHHFMVNKIKDPGRADRLLFDYSMGAPVQSESSQSTLLRDPKRDKIEGQNDEATYTKVVDRRWYEKNKHIYPATLWRTYRESNQNGVGGGGSRKDQDTVDTDFFYSQW